MAEPFGRWEQGVAAHQGCVCLSLRVLSCADTGARADIHQLAAGVRTRRALLSELQQQWNELVKVRGGRVCCRRCCW